MITILAGSFKQFITVTSKMAFASKIVIVTGSSSGIGAAAAVAFAKEGANVVIVGRNEKKLQRVREECAKTGNEPLLMKADITNEEDAKKIIQVTIEKFGKLDVLVNNAGVVKDDDILNGKIMPVYDSVMNINLRAHVFMTHLAAPHLIKTKGNIINISSIASKMNGGRLISYAMSKAALDHFTKSVAAALAPHGVRVNSVSPGPVRTDILSNSGHKISIDFLASATALGRVSDAEEVADLILFLASDKARATTGSDYVTDNGYMLKR